MKSALVLVAAVLCLAALPASATTTVILPPACESVDCVGSTPAISLPFSVQIQQIFSSSLFVDDGFTGPVSITGVSLRPSTVNTATAGDVNLTLMAGTTAVFGDAGCTDLKPGGGGTSAGCTYLAPLSTAGLTTVFSGIQHFTTTNTGTPRTFDYTVMFTTPLIYDPTAGSSNLLFDILIAANGVTNVVGGTMGFQAIGGANRQPGTGAVTFSALSQNLPASGLVVQFITEPVASEIPEPATFGLIGAGLASLFLVRRRRQRS